MTMKNEYSRVFKVFGNESRIRILEILCEGEECACILLDDLKIKQPTLSHHMQILCDSGLVKERKVGKWSYYSINESGCDYASKLIRNIKENSMDSIIKSMLYIFAVMKPIKHFFSSSSKDDLEMSNCQCECSLGKNNI